MNYFSKTMKSPVGVLKLVASEKGLAGVLWPQDKISRVPYFFQNSIERLDHPLLIETENQLKEYFLGRRRKFDLALDFVGEVFHQRVWNELLTIPYGETRTYGQIAKQIGVAQGARAVGLANSKNPISIIAPCHRVIGANGKLTGFAGGLKVKAELLRLESQGLTIFRRL